MKLNCACRAVCYRTGVHRGRHNLSVSCISTALTPHIGSFDSPRKRWILCSHCPARTEDIILSCIACPAGLNQHERARVQRLAEACGAALQNGVYQLAHWSLSDGNANINQAIEELNQVFDFELSYFETELAAWKNNPDRRIRPFPHSEQELVHNTDLPDEFYIEGAQKQILTNRYERNPKARARCIAAHGSACAVCGFDFGLVFGEKFSGKIEVHHKKPISEIGESYVVDPVNDLVPVCPNCHMMLHSKPSGVYTVEELRGMRICVPE